MGRFVTTPFCQSTAWRAIEKDGRIDQQDNATTRWCRTKVCGIGEKRTGVYGAGSSQGVAGLADAVLSYGVLRNSKFGTGVHGQSENAPGGVIEGRKAQFKLVLSQSETGT